MVCFLAKQCYISLDIEKQGEHGFVGSYIFEELPTDGALIYRHKLEITDFFILVHILG